MVTATIVVMGVVGLLVGLGVFVLAAPGRRKSGGAKKCGVSGCGGKNRADAEFCARCGAKLG
ncbi:MAG: hypothetical protein IID33_15650 [Planctomycetes bacterium]|nr:hypothetical protein [Planctomycetota bacterium]